MGQKWKLDVAAAVSILAVIIAARSAYDAGRSADAAEDARDAVRLEQRAWLGYAEINLTARRGTEGSWENREPLEGDYGRIRLFVANTGRTPATNVRFLRQGPVLIPDGAELELPELSESDWHTPDLEHVVVPGTENRFHDVQFRLDRQARYVTGAHVLFVWVRMEYCDVAHRAHWAQAGVMHRYGEPLDVFWTLSQSISPADSAEPDHERCPRPK